MYYSETLFVLLLQLILSVWCLAMCHVASHRNWNYQIFFGTNCDRCLIAVPAGVPTLTRTAAAVSRPASAWGRAASSSTEASSNLPSTPFLTLHPQVLDIYPFKMLGVATIFMERKKAFKLILFREYLHCTLYSKLLNMTKGWQKFTGCWRNRIFISKYNYFVHLKCWRIWISPHLLRYYTAVFLQVSCIKVCSPSGYF